MQLKVSLKYVIQVIDDLIKNARNTVLAIQNSYKVRLLAKVHPDVYNREYQKFLNEWCVDAIKKLEEIFIDYALIDSFKFPKFSIATPINEDGNYPR